jgi:hypothetical protein
MLDEVLSIYVQTPNGVKIMSSVKINWKKPFNKTDRLFFSDIAVNQGFKIYNCEAIYIKIEANPGLHLECPYCMYEVATGKFFKPTISEVLPVDIEISIAISKPSIY